MWRRLRGFPFDARPRARSGEIRFSPSRMGISIRLVLPFFFLTGEGKEDHKNIPLSFFLPFFLSSYRGCFLLTKRFRLLLLLRLLPVTTAKHDQAGQRYLGDGRIQRHVRLPSRRRRGRKHRRKPSSIQRTTHHDPGPW